MPYLTCSSCGLPTYCVSEGTCPACGTALRRTHPPVGPRPARAADGEVRAKLPMACRELQRRRRAADRDPRRARAHPLGGGRGRLRGRSVPLRDTICERLLDGRIGSMVADTRGRAGAAAASRSATSRAYIGVPFTTADARAYVLCCLAHEARPDLGEADVRFLQGLAESLRPVLGREAPRARGRRARVAGCGGGGRRRRRAPTAQRGRAAAEGRRLRRAGVRHRAAGGQVARVRRRAGRHDPACVKGGKKLAAVPRHHATSSTRGGEQGLLSMAFAPDYASSGLFYVYYTDTNGDEQVVEYKRRPDDAADPGRARQVLVRRPTTRATTTAASCSSGPTSCSTSAPATAAAAATSTARTATARTSATLLGKILRIDPQGERRRGRTRSRPTTRSSGAVGRARRRSTPTACATRGASRSTARPAT